MGTDGEQETTLPVLVDAHVHLGLVDARSIRAGGIGRVVDLGWDPATAARWAADAAAPAGARAGSDRPEVVVAGGLLGAPGGYPSRAGWAPPGAAVPMADAAGARDAVQAMLGLGARVVKVAMNADAGPVPDDVVLAAVVDAAHAGGVAVAAHVQGIGQAVRAEAAGIDVLAHTPFSEVLDDALVHRFAARTTWISTLDIHGYGRGGRSSRIARQNLERFHRAGGDVRYGTDLGNGPLPVGVDPREIDALVRAGLDGDAVLAAMTTGTRSGWDPFAEPSALETRVPGPRPERDDDLGAWLARASVRAVPTCALPTPGVPTPAVPTPDRSTR